VVDQAATVDVDGQVRRYTWTASGRRGRKPLVLDLHGLLEGTFAVHPIMSQFSPKALDEGFVVAYPVGELGGVLWDLSETGPSLRFIDALLAKVEADACIDRDRIYVSGLSYGAFMTSAIMCYRSDVFAAAAPVAGLLNPCGQTARKIPVVTFHGTSDPILWYAFFKDAPQAWATKYGCGPSTRRTVVDADPVTQQPVFLDSWDCRAQHTAVESYVIEGGGHAWPGSWFSTLIGIIVGKTATSIDATDVIWDFFERHPMRHDGRDGDDG
jgi:polyhydroxybutyrate depolymerase